MSPNRSHKGKLAPGKHTTTTPHGGYLPHSMSSSLPLPHFNPSLVFKFIISNLLHNSSSQIQVLFRPERRDVSIGVRPTRCWLVISIVHPRSRLSGSPLARLGGTASFDVALLARFEVAHAEVGCTG